MPPPQRLLLLLLLHHLISAILLLFLCASVTAQQHPDLLPLLAFKSSLTASSSHVLSNWTASSATPCSWPHVTCLHGRVSHLLLPNLRLSSSSFPSSLFPLLSSLTKLRLLSLQNNSFTGPILIPSNLTVTLPIRLLFLSRNSFSGPFPSQLLSHLPRLLRLDLSRNLLSGPLPLSVPFPPSLITLRLELNNFSGSIPSLSLSLSALRDFNVSANALSGPIPRQLSAFPASSFSGNPGLCGAPLSACAGFSSDPTRPGLEITPPMSKPESVITSSPSSMPTSVAAPANPHRSAAERMKPFALIAIIVGDFLVLVVISWILYCYFWRSCAEEMGEGRKKSMSKVLAGEKIVYSTSPYPVNPPGSGGCDRGKMVFFDAGVQRFELEDLLRASAEMLGKGWMGTAYKAVLEAGSVVAVKRLRDVGNGGMGRREVEERMEVLGGIRHGNVVGLRAYYFSTEEKLLVYDYMPNGSLFWLLHGNRGVGRTPVDWTTRLKIAAGAASGITFIHSSCKSLKIIHGNIKSTNILIDRSGNACVTNYGLTAFLSSSLPPRPNGYRAPEAAADNRKLTQKSDVYSFGVVLLELLTGKCPSAADDGNVVEYGGGTVGVLDLPRWVQSVVREEWTAEVFDLELMRYKDIEEGMVGLLQVALACTCAAPEQRPKMGQVVQMIEEIRGFDISHSNESLDSPSQSEGTSQ